MTTDWQALFLSPNGRIGPRDFWIGIAILILTGFVVNLIPIAGMVLGSVWIFAGVYFNFCVFSKRLHDIGLSAWYFLFPFVFGLMVKGFAVLMGLALIFGFAAEQLTVIGDFANGLGTYLIWGLVAGAALSWLGVVFAIGIRPGQTGENRFGPARDGV